MSLTPDDRQSAVPAAWIFGRDVARARERHAAFMLGLRASRPALMPTAIWGVVAGIAMIKTGLTVAQALAMTLLIYSGSAQMAVLPLVAADAPVSIALLTAFVVNLRFVIFSATLWPYFGRLPMPRRLALGYVATDVGLALFVARHADSPEHERGNQQQLWFFLGVASAIWLAWQPASIAGILLAGVIPGHWGLEFAAILALMVMTAPMLAGRPAIVGALVAGVVAVAAAGLPLKLGLLLGVIAGVAAAMAVDATAGHPPAETAR